MPSSVLVNVPSVILSISISHIFCWYASTILGEQEVSVRELADKFYKERKGKCKTYSGSRAPSLIPSTKYGSSTIGSGSETGAVKLGC